MIISTETFHGYLIDELAGGFQVHLRGKLIGYGLPSMAEAKNLIEADIISRSR